MVRHLIALTALLSLAACKDELTRPETSHPWDCGDLHATADFAWSVDAALDTIVTMTVRVRYPDDACPTESAWFQWTRADGIGFRSDRGVWAPANGGRLEAVSLLTRDDWAAHGDSLVVIWGCYPDFDVDSCDVRAPFDCEERATIDITSLIPSRGTE